MNAVADMPTVAAVHNENAARMHGVMADIAFLSSATWLHQYAKNISSRWGAI